VSLATAAPETPQTHVPVDARTQRRRATFLFAFAAWNVWVWATRLVNLFDDTTTYSVPFVVVHSVLFVGGFGGAAVLTVMGVRMRREANQTKAGQ
jgi:hypothetical protein